ncbi:MAG: hypothetical protein AB8B64_26230 [Granulosicoccus sp.]
MPFAFGLFGLPNLSAKVLAFFVDAVTLLCGIFYVLHKAMVSRNRFMGAICLFGSGNVSGVSLMGAPLMVAYSTSRPPAAKQRDTLFVMWILLVIGKLTSFMAAGVNLQWQFSALTLPRAAFGHFLGLQAHHSLVGAEHRQFNLVIGLGLCCVSILGLWAAL